MKKTKKLDMWTVLSFVILLCYAVFLLYPMLNLLRQSVVTTDGAFTLEYFQKFFGKSYYLITLWNSFKVSIAVTIITLIIGVPLAYLYNMYEIKGKGLLQIIIILCSMSAPFIGAYSWILMLGNSGIIRKTIKSMLGIALPSIYGFNGILLVLSLQLFPLVFLYVSGAMKNIDNSLLEAAESMGCKGIKRFLTVIVPLCMPTILAAMLLVFMRAFADFGTPLLIGQGYRTFPVEIYNAFFSETTGGDYGFACATSVIAIVITTVVFLVQKWSSNKFSFTMNALHPVERKKAHGLLNVLIHLFTYLVVGIAFLPQVYIFYESFRKTSGKAFVPGYSLDSYRSAMKVAGSAIKNTFVIGIAALVLIILLAVLVAYLVIRRKNTVNNVIDVISMLPYIIPGSVVGIALIMAFNRKPLILTGTMIIMVIALVIRRLPSTMTRSAVRWPPCSRFPSRWRKPPSRWVPPRPRPSSRSRCP